MLCSRMDRIGCCLFRLYNHAVTAVTFTRSGSTEVCLRHVILTLHLTSTKINIPDTELGYFQEILRQFRFKITKPIELAVPRVTGYPVALDRHARDRVVVLDSRNLADMKSWRVRTGRMEVSIPTYNRLKLDVSIFMSAMYRIYGNHVTASNRTHLLFPCPDIRVIYTAPPEMSVRVGITGCLTVQVLLPSKC